jgi:hypothetical protein
MVRMEIQMTERQARLLKAKAQRVGLSVSALVLRAAERESEPENEPQPRVITEEMKQRARSVIGKYHDTATDVSVNHDKYYVEAIMS